VIDDGRVRAAFVIGVFSLLGACSSPVLVDCDPGLFARADGEAWCLFARGVAVGCPRELPIEHDLPWGGRGCAAVEHDPVPADLCAADPACGNDAG